ncbi:MAG: alpha/beta fold hydrolase [Nitrososphaerales archaeon]
MISQRITSVLSFPRKLANSIPASKIFTHPEAGHNPHITQPEEFTRAVTAFAKSSGQEFPTYL